MPIVMWKVMVQVIVWNRWLRIVVGMMTFWPWSVLVWWWRGVVVVSSSKVFVRVLRFSIVHVWIVVIGIRSIIYGIVVVVSIAAWLIFRIPDPTQHKVEETKNF